MGWLVTRRYISSSGVFGDKLLHGKTVFNTWYSSTVFSAMNAFLVRGYVFLCGWVGG